MTKFFYVFLLNLLVFSEKHHFDAHLLPPQTVDENNIEDPDQDDVGSITVSDTDEDLQENPEELRQKPFDYSDGTYLLEKLKNPVLLFSSDYPQKVYNPEEKRREFNLLEPSSGYNFNDQLTSMSEWNNALYHDCMKATLKRWRNFQKRRSRSFPMYWSSLLRERPSAFVDYTNSQMPFNEGKMQQKSNEGLEKKSNEVLDTDNDNENDNTDTMNNWSTDNKLFNYEKLSNRETPPSRFQRSMRRRFQSPLRFQEENFQLLPDDPMSQYSRVRRFLDHERAKKRKRMPGTLEAKEAAMSRVLDPNLNLDGILEPHVRKRRGQHTKKRDLSFSLKWKENRSKRHKPEIRMN